MGQEWVVLGASVVINCLLKGSLKSLGVVLEELNRHGIDPSQSSWIPAIAYTLFACLSAPVARLPRFFPPRWVALLGGLMASIGMCPSSMIPSHPQTFSNYIQRFPSRCQFFPSSPLPWPWRCPGYWRLPRSHHRGAGDQQEVHGDEEGSGSRVEPGGKHTGRFSPPRWDGSPL